MILDHTRRQVPCNANDNVMSVFLCLFLSYLVFRSKVLQRLFPVAPKLEKEPSPPRIVDALAKKTFVTRKTTQEDTAAGTIRNLSIQKFRKTAFFFFSKDTFTYQDIIHVELSFTCQLLTSLQQLLTAFFVCLRWCRADAECSQSPGSGVHCPSSSCRLQDTSREIGHTLSTRKYKLCQGPSW